MASLAFLLMVCVMFFLAIEGTHALVYGWFIDEEELDMYLDKHLPNATLNPYSEDGTLFSSMPRFVSRSQTFLTKWYISEYGTIPRWSKWTQRIDQRRAELMRENPVITKKLSDF